MTMMMTSDKAGDEGRRDEGRRDETQKTFLEKSFPHLSKNLKKGGCAMQGIEQVQSRAQVQVQSAKCGAQSAECRVQNAE